jgi:glucose/arabinose dehydrogenase
MTLRVCLFAFLLGGFILPGYGQAQTPAGAVKLFGPADQVALPAFTPGGPPKERKIVAWPAGRMPTAPAGFRVTLFAEGFTLPRWLYVLPNGDVLVSEVGGGADRAALRGQGKVWLLRDADKDGKAEVKEQFVTGLDRPFGMALIRDRFYVTNTGALLAFPYRAGQTQLPGTGDKVLDLIPDGQHWTRPIAAKPDGSKIYVSVGSASDWSEDDPDKLPAERAAIWEVNPDGSGKRVYATGIRNAVGMGFAPGSNNLWAVVNERALLGDSLPPDYFMSIREGGFYGWPYSYWGKVEDPRNKVSRRELVSRAITPEYALNPHAAPLGMTFATGNSFPQQYRGGAFIAFHGSSARTSFVGYEVSYIRFQNGRPVGDPQPFLTGFVSNADAGEVFGRPVGLAVGRDGSLLVVDDAANRIWQVTYTGGGR